MSSQLHAKRIAKVRQACDCCHARKIRCDGTNPCANCLTTELQCTYLAVPKKKGPKGRRAARDSPGKPIQRPFPIPPGTVNPQVESPPKLVSQNVEQSKLLETDMFDAPEIGVLDFQSSPLVTIEMMRSCLDAYFTHKYPITPILDQEQTYAMLPHLNQYPEQYGLITACCAVIVLSPEIISPSPSNPEISYDTMPSSEFLISETVRARQFCNHIEAPSLSTVHTSFFLFAALFCLGKDNSAWFYIREAMTILQLLRLHEETTYTTFTDPQYSTSCRRTFWLLFITERAYALQRHRPLTLQRTISLPNVDPGREATILSGFLDLVSLFQNFDDKFLSLWNLSSTPSSASPESLIRLQDILKCALPNVAERTEIQQADLLVSRQWLKTMVWQLCVSKGLLSSQSNDESMSFHYPVTIARDVVLVSRLLPPKAFEANGVGILEKVFDIGCSLADVLLLSKGGVNEVSGMEVGPRDYLMELVRILGTVLGGSSKYLSLLARKADECLQVRGVRGSLSSSGDEHGIYEIDDDEEDLAENFVHTGDPLSAETGYEHPISKGSREIGMTRMFGPEPPFNFNQRNHSSDSKLDGLGMEMSNGDAGGIYELSAPEWNDILETDSTGFVSGIFA